LGIFTNIVLLAFASEKTYGKSMRIIGASTYVQYFGQKFFCYGIKNVGDRLGAGVHTNPHANRFTLLKQSPDGVTGYIPAD